jgi:hypothetical protein
MDGAPKISLTEQSEWSCPRCHFDLSTLPPTAQYCPRCGKHQLDIPLAEVAVTPVSIPAMPPAPPVPEHFHSVMIVGYARAMNQLGTRYEAGNGVARNSDEALRCYCKAARLGNSEARLRLTTRGIPASQKTADDSSEVAEIDSSDVAQGVSTELAQVTDVSTSPDAPSDPPSPPVATAPQTP